MTFSPFSALKARIIADTLRTDATFAAEIPGFVALAEQRMYYGDGADRVRCRAMETSSAPGFTDGAASVPTGFLEPLSLTWGAYQPSHVDHATFWAEKSHTSTYPTMYMIEGDVIRIWPAMTGTARLAYVGKLTPLVADGDTNWILQHMPALYLHGVLIEAWRYLRNPEKMAESATLYRGAVGALNRTEARARFTPGSLVRQARVPMP